MTLKARVIPCLDVKDGRVVKGVNFVDLIDAGDPVEAARAYAEREGIEVHVVPPAQPKLKIQAYADNFR